MELVHDKNHEVDGNIVGLAHYRRMPRPLRGQDIGFLDDLFIDLKYKGKKIGKKLINKIKALGFKLKFSLEKGLREIYQDK